MLAPNVLNDKWTLDFMRDGLYDGRPFRTLNVIDKGNREALRIECGTSISGHRLTRVMSELVEVYGKPNAILHVLRAGNDLAPLHGLGKRQ